MKLVITGDREVAAKESVGTEMIAPLWRERKTAGGTRQASNSNVPKRKVQREAIETPEQDFATT
jgi:hypothetical protein